MPSPPTHRRREALRLLGLQEPVDRSEVVGAYRRLARLHHPDLGGDPDLFRSLTVARDLLLADTPSDAGTPRDPGAQARSPGGRSVTGRQRTSRRFVRRLRRRLGRKKGARRDLD